MNDSPSEATAVFVAYGMTSLPLAWIPPDAPVIVVHNDELLDEDACHPSVEHIHPGRNLGFGHAVNLAVERVRTRRVVICNPDMAFLPEHWPSLASGAEGELVTVRLLDGDHRPMTSVLPYPSPTLLAAGTFDAIRLAPPDSRRRALLARTLGSWGEERRWAVETPPSRYALSDHWVTGAVFSIDTALFRSVGGFDPGYFLYLEDTDLCRRLGRASPDTTIVVSAATPAIHQLGGSARTPEAIRLVRRSQWDSAVRYARSQQGTRWNAVSGLLSIGRWADRVHHPGGDGADGYRRQPHVSVLVHYGHHEGTTGSHFAEAAERLELGTAIRSAHRSHVRLADVRSPVYLWIESGVTTIPLDAHLAPCLTAGYLIDTHLHLDESIRQAHLFDVVFVAQRDDVEAIARVHPQVHWMPLAAPASFLSVPRQHRYQASFVGNLWPSTPRREIMEAVSKRVTTNDWSRHWSVDQMARIYAASQVVVNPAVRDDLNMRFFEALACGAHVVMPPMGNGAAEIAVEGRDFFTCDFSEGAESVAAAVEEAVASSDSGDHGRALVAAGHTYDHRIRQVIDTCTSAHRSAPIRSMTETQRSAFLSDLAHDYKDLGIFRSAVRTSPRGVLDATRPWWDTAAQGTWKWAKERVKERSPEVAARLRQWRPVAADRRITGEARPLLNAVVVTYASRHDVGRCLDSLLAVRDMGTVVVVDHGDDGSGQVASSMGAVVVHDPANPGFGAGHNRGVALTRARYVLLMNPDAALVPGAVEEGLALLDAQPSVAACQGAIVDETTGVPERSHGVLLGPGHLWGRALRLRGLLRWRLVRSVVRRLPGFADHVERVPDGPVDTAALGATALLVRREAFDAVGGFDTRFFLYGEDMDLSRRWTEAGWRLVALPMPWAVHHAGGSSGSSWEREVEWWRGSMTFAATWYQERAWAMAVGAAMVRSATLGACRPSRATAAWQAMVVAPRNARMNRHVRSHAES